MLVSSLFQSFMTHGEKIILKGLSPARKKVNELGFLQEHLIGGINS